MRLACQTAPCTWRALFRDASCSGQQRPTAETTLVRRWCIWTALDELFAIKQQPTGSEERRKVAVENRTRYAAAKRSGCRPELMSRKHPTEDEVGPLAAELRRRQLHGRRHRRDPVEPVEE